MKIEELKAYELVEKKELKEVNGIGYVLSHKKTKARVLVVTNDDKDKVFTIGFRTPPADDMGIPHIMEHSVLCGSKKFPAKDPFVELCKGSLNTFLNAMTYSDKTVYPVSSLNHKDFHNLMHVYLDAVFYPNIYEKEQIMMQEGWHYEIDEETGDLKYNGVVYNEMKGVYSSASQQLYRLIEKSLHEHTAYSYESGGDPTYITDLDRETFLDFHRNYYHPSNSYIYLYGDLDVAKELQFIDEEYLSNYEYKYIASELTDEEPFEEPKSVKEFYALAEAEEEVDNTYLSYNVLVGKSVDKKLCLAFNILDYALLTAPGAPLKKALIDAGIGKDVFSSYDDGIKQPTFSVIAKNANPEDEERFIELINKTLIKMVETGINKKALNAAINVLEFRHKEANFGRFGKGLMLGLNTFSEWLYDDSLALDLFSLNELFEEMKKEVDCGYFEKLIKDYILNNNTKTYVMLQPKKGYGAKREEAEAKKLAAYKQTLSDEEIENIKIVADSLKQYQSEPSTAEELATIPMLKISDIEKKEREIRCDVSEIEQVKVLSYKTFTNGISYVGLRFDIGDIDCDKYPYISLLSDVFKYVDTEKYGYDELSNEINMFCGGMRFSLTISNEKETNKPIVAFAVKAKMLHENIDAVMDLINEILFTSKIDDKKRLKEIIAETRAALKNDLVSSGNQTASDRAKSYISEAAAINELVEGVDYYKFLADLEDNFEDRYVALSENLKSIIGEVLRRGGLTATFISEKEPEKCLSKSISKLSKLLSTRALFDNPKKPELSVKNEGFKTSSQVQYVAMAGNYSDKNLEYTGALKVLSLIFSYDYLWINVRVKGGAYGASCSFTRNGYGHFSSYRDPNLMETYNIYKAASDYVRNFEADERDMTKYIIGTISKLDTPLTPVAEGEFNIMSYITGITSEDIQKDRDEVLSTNVEKIRALAPYIDAIVSDGIICAIGNENRIKKDKDNFKSVEAVF